jgi:hypothetical protein
VRVFHGGKTPGPIEVTPMHTPTERSVLNLFRHLHLHPASRYTLAEITTFTGASAATVSDTVQKLVKAGELVRTREGNVSVYHKPVIMAACDAQERVEAYTLGPQCKKFFSTIPMEPGE